MSATVELDDDSITPLKIDMLGIERDMGYLRPSLSRIGKSKYRAQFQIPICDIQQMNWQIRLILKKSNDSLFVATYSLETKDKK